MDLLRTVGGLLALLVIGLWLIHWGLRDQAREQLRGRVEPYL